ncbi:MAG TPA: alpha/beta hydrolase [Kineosporiaceae bacterium]
MGDPEDTPGATGRRPRVGLLSLGAGLAAAGVGAALGVAAERLAVGRPLLPPSDDDGPGYGEDYGGLHVPGVVVGADDGTPIHVEIEEPDAAHAARIARGEQAPLTVVLSHGYALSMDSWHFQRKALRGRHRMVLWDQRGHGRSGTGPPGSATIDQLGRDLAAVIDAVAPDGPLVLVGHSMGGMTVMALADRRPEVFAERVVGVALVSTSAGGLADVDFGVAAFGPLVQRLAPGALRTLNRTPRLVERARRLGSDLEAVLVRRWSYASDVPPALVAFTARMLAATRLEVIADYLPTFSEHDKRAALAALDGIEVLVIVGDRDLLTPAAHSEAIVEVLPGAEHVVVRHAGHLLLLEHPEVVNEHLAGLVDRALRSWPKGGARPGRRIRLPGIRRTVTSLRGAGSRGRRGGRQGEQGRADGARRRGRGRRSDGAA